MQNPLQIFFHDIQHNKDIEVTIVEKFAKINAEISNVTKCHVVLENLSKHHKKANMACVRLDLKVGHFEDIVVTENCLEDAVSLSSAVLKVFKHGLELAHKHKKRLVDSKRIPFDALPVEKVVDAGNE